MTEGERDTEVPVTPTGHPFDEAREFGGDSYDERADQAQSLLANSNAYSAIIEVPEGMALLSDVKNADTEEDEVRRRALHIGTLLRSIAYEEDMTLIEATKKVLSESDPERWDRTDWDTRSLPTYLAPEQEQEGEDVND